jgi:hypothetical protein
MLNDPPLGAVNWPDGPVGPTVNGATVGAFPCGIRHDAISYHIHVHVSIFLNGTRLRIPSSLGIAGPNAPSPLCMYALHTHDSTGIVHAENPVPARFTLGQFFSLWGQPLTDANVAGLTGLPLVVWLVDRNDSNQLTLTRHTGDPAEIEFVPRRNIVLQLGTPLTQIQPYRYGSE